MYVIRKRALCREQTSAKEPHAEREESSVGQRRLLKSAVSTGGAERA